MKRIEHSGALADLADESLELAQPALQHVRLAQLEGLLQLLAQHPALNQTQIRNRVLVDVLVQVLPARELILQHFYAARGAGVQVRTYEVESNPQGLQLSHGVGGKVNAGVQELHVQKRLCTELGQKSGGPFADAVFPEVPVVDDACWDQLSLHIHAVVAVVGAAEGAHSWEEHVTQIYINLELKSY